MDNKKHNIIPHVIFMALLLNSLSMFLVSNFGKASLVLSISYSLLMLVISVFVLANLHEIYLRKTGFYIKLIIPWIVYMWLTSVVLLGSYSFNDRLRAICFQSGSLLLFLCFYIQGKRCTPRNFNANQRLFFILTLVTVCFFSFELVMGRRRYSGDFLVVGYVLYLTMLLPWITILNNKVLKKVFLPIIFCLALFSLKRSALLQISVGGSFYIIIQNTIVRHRKGILLLLLTPFILLGLFTMLLYVDTATSGALFRRVQNIQADAGSGRLDVWASLWQRYKTWPLFDQIVGKGFYAVSEVSRAHGRAHSDFLEALLGYGAIGFLANVFFSIYLSVKAVQLVLRRHPYAASFAFGVISFWIISLVSYNLYFMVWNLYLLAFLGYICGIDQQDRTFRTFYPDLTTLDYTDYEVRGAGQTCE